MTEDFRTGQADRGTRSCSAGPEQAARTGQRSSDAQRSTAGTGEDIATGQSPRDAQPRVAYRDQDPVPTSGRATPNDEMSVPGEQGQSATSLSTPNLSTLADPMLGIQADALDDLERTRIASENRLRQLTRDQTDGDGEERGFGLTFDHPDVARLAAIVEALGALEHQAVLALQRSMRRHPLGPWVASQRGVGEKQAARLLAAIGDPYWHYLEDRPRTVSELWAYCGLKPGQRRRKGQRANWSAEAKMRAHNIAESTLKAGNREVYDKRKAATEGRAHVEPCPQCGPTGNPAQPGSLWSDGHRHQDALRITSKHLLKLLWRASRDLYHGA